MRVGNFHISQPSLYADALASLDLRPGLSFLNVGSGTGYLSSIVSEVLGRGLHHCIEVNQDVLDHAAQMFKQQGKDYISLFQVNAYDLDVALSPRYDRIYVGACIDEGSQHLLELLEVGGILVGPFVTPRGQFIRRVLRRSDENFEVKNLKSVSFGRLVPSPTPPVSRFVLPCRVWTPEHHAEHSPGFRAAVREVLLCTTHSSSPAHILPRDIFVKHIFGYLHPRWFDEPPTMGVRLENLDSSADIDADDDETETRRMLEELIALRRGELFFALQRGELFVRAAGEPEFRPVRNALSTQQRQEQPHPEAGRQQTEQVHPSQIQGAQTEPHLGEDGMDLDE